MSVYRLSFIILLTIASILSIPILILFATPPGGLLNASNISVAVLLYWGIAAPSVTLLYFLIIVTGFFVGCCAQGQRGGGDGNGNVLPPILVSVFNIFIQRFIAIIWLGLSSFIIAIRKSAQSELDSILEFNSDFDPPPTIVPDLDLITITEPMYLALIIMCSVQSLVMVSLNVLLRKWRIVSLRMAAEPVPVLLDQDIGHRQGQEQGGAGAGSFQMPPVMTPATTSSYTPSPLGRIPEVTPVWSPVLGYDVQFQAAPGPIIVRDEDIERAAHAEKLR